MSATGCFITFEGIEGSGKSTQLARVADWLRGAGRLVVTTREPGGTTAGQTIRRLLLDPASELGAEAELFLYLADRAEVMRQVIEPALRSGATVLGDRHIDATLAYQGSARGLGVARLATLNDFATRGRRPDLTLLFDLEASLGLERARRRAGEQGRPDRLEAESVTFHDDVRRAYLELAGAESDRIKVIDASGSPEDVFNRVRREFAAALPDLAVPS